MKTWRAQFVMVPGLVLALSACSGAPPAPSATDEAQETEFVEETEAVETDAPEETLPVDPGATPTFDPSTYDDGNGWSVTPTANLTGTGNDKLDGIYSATDTARICGLTYIDQYANPNAFSFEWPLDGIHELHDITFGADLLAPGTTTGSFFLSVNITLADGHTAPSYVFNTVDHPGQESGIAALTFADGHRLLEVDAHDDLGRHVIVHADCVPPSS